MSDDRFIAVQKRGPTWWIWVDSVKNHNPSPIGDHQEQFDLCGDALFGAADLYSNLEGVPYGIMPLGDIEDDPIELAISTLKEASETMAGDCELYDKPIVDRCLVVAGILRELQQKGDYE